MSKALPRSIRFLLTRFVPDSWKVSITGDFEELWESSLQNGRASIRLWLRALGVALRFQWLHWERLVGSESYRESLYRAPSGYWLIRFMEALLRDLTYSASGLMKAPGFALVAVLIMGLGIGANTAMFSVVGTMLWQRQPLSRESDLLRIYTEREDGLPEGVSFPDFTDYFSDNPLIEEAAFSYDATFLNLLTERGAEVVLGEYYSADFMEVVGLTPSMGRGFTSEENRPLMAPAVAMMSYDEWQTRYAGDPSVLGIKVRLNGFPVTIVGVGPKDYTGTLIGFNVNYFLPLGTAAEVDASVARSLNQRKNRGFFIFARPAAGVTREQVEASLDARAAQLARDYPETNRDHPSVAVIPATEVQLHPAFDLAILPISLILMTVAGLVLLVACSNLANLLLMRAASRSREVAIRRAMGASRWRLVKLLLAESTLLGLMGGLVGWIMAAGLSRFLLSFDSPLPVPIALDPKLDHRVLAFTGLVSLGTGIVFGLAPALRASRLDLVPALKNALPGFDLGGRRLNLRKFFVTIQVTASLFLLSVGGLCLHSLMAGQDRDFGFQAEGLSLAVLDPELGGHVEEGAPGRFFQKLKARLSQDPEIQRVAFGHRIPFSFFGTDRYPYQGPDGSSDDRLPSIEYAIVESDYFELMGIRILAGEGFQPGFQTGGEPVAIVSRSFAEKQWGRTSVIGESLQLEDSERRSLRIIGVAEDLSYGRDQTDMLYLPFGQNPRCPMIVLVRSAGHSEELTTRLRLTVNELDPNVPILEAKSMSEHLGIAFFVPRLLGVLLSIFGLVAMLLAGVGLYGLVAYSVSNRYREIAVRLTLGARTRQLILLLVREGVGLVGTGAILGLILSALASVLLSRWLYGIAPLDPIVLAGVLSILLAIAALASYIPARRMLRVNPIESLRYE